MWCIPLQCCFYAALMSFYRFLFNPEKMPRWFLLVNLAIRAGNVRLVGLSLVRSYYGDHFHVLFCALFNQAVTAVLYLNNTSRFSVVSYFMESMVFTSKCFPSAVSRKLCQAILTPLCIKLVFLPYAHSMCLLIYLWVSYRPPSHTVWVGQGIFATKPHGGTVSSPCCYWSSCYRLIFI